MGRWCGSLFCRELNPQSQYYLFRTSRLVNYVLYLMIGMLKLPNTLTTLADLAQTEQVGCFDGSFGYIPFVLYVTQYENHMDYGVSYLIYNDKISVTIFLILIY